MPVILAAGTAGLAAVFLLIIALLSTVFGAVVGFVVGLFFPQVIEAINIVTRLELTGWNAGALLGFVGSFFRSIQTNNNS